MWLVRVALDRPYTFVVLALLVLIMSAVAISTTPGSHIRRMASASPCSISIPEA